jgi:uncharacterized membrane protein
MNPKKRRVFTLHLQRYVFTGILTVIPIWITWLVFEFVFKQLSGIGMPWVRALSKGLRQTFPALSEWLVASWFHSGLAVALTLMALYLLGWVATLVIGKRLIGLLDWFMNRIPLVQTIYGGVKKLLTALQQKPDRVQRVVLIPFPTPEMRNGGICHPAA